MPEWWAPCRRNHPTSDSLPVKEGEINPPASAGGGDPISLLSDLAHARRSVHNLLPDMNAQTHKEVATPVIEDARGAMDGPETSISTPVAQPRTFRKGDWTTRRALIIGAIVGAFFDKVPTIQAIHPQP